MWHCGNQLIICFPDVEMNYEMLAEIDDEIGDLHILDTANTVRVISVYMHNMRNESYQFHSPCACACPSNIFHDRHRILMIYDLTILSI